MIGQFIAEHPGVISLELRDKEIRMSLMLFVILIFIGLLALNVIFEAVKNAVKLPLFLQQTRNRKRRDKFLDHLWLGFINLVKGDYSQAKKSFLEGQDDGIRPEISFLAAAFSANCLGSKAERDQLLDAVKRGDPQLSDISEYCRAWMAMDSGDLDIARQLIEKSRGNSSRPGVELDVSIRYLEKTLDGNGLIDLFENLQSSAFTLKSPQTRNKKSTALVILGDISVSKERKLDFWKKLSRKHRSDPKILEVYIRFLIKERMYSLAETILLQQLKRKWEPSLVLIYSQIPIKPVGKQLEQLEEWSRIRGCQTELKLAKAYYAVRVGLWGVAKIEAENLCAEEPTPTLYHLLAEIAAATGETQKAHAYRENGLILALEQLDSDGKIGGG